MPFAYYGAKHRLAPKYPAPKHKVIVEPFAGSAAYSCFHADRVDHVVIVEKDDALYRLWKRLQGMTPADVDEVWLAEIGKPSTFEPLIFLSSGSESLNALRNGKARAVTPRMIGHARSVPKRIKRALPYVKRWDIIHGDYTDAPDIEATWFIDPPYQPLLGATEHTAGRMYGADSLDYAALANWCKQRRGQVMVCEQEPAAWLPFKPFAQQMNGAHVSKSMRTEVLYYRNHQGV